jgi:ketosteroid isomerase-like protein
MMKTSKTIATCIALCCVLSAGWGQAKQTAVTTKDSTAITNLANLWNDAIAQQDMPRLATLYADSVAVYGVFIPQSQAIANKIAFFKKHTGFSQHITGAISITKIRGSQYKAVFPKQSSFDGKTSEVQGYLLFDKIAGNWKIVKESDVVTDKNLSKPKKATAATVGTHITGDFDGDGVTETISTRILKADTGSEDELYELSIDFSGGRVKSMKENYNHEWLYFINEGDLNDIPGDELTIYSPPNHGCTYDVTTYTFVNGKWKLLMEPFMIPTSCEDISDDALQQKIFREGNTIYYYDMVPTDTGFKTVKRKAKLN